MTEKNKTPGQVLRDARDAHALSLADVAKEMRLSPQAVDNLERDDYGSMGARTFVRGYLAIYARIVDVPQASILAMFDEISPAPETTPFLTSAVEGAPITDVTRERAAFRYPPKIAIAIVGAVCILFAFVFHSGKTTMTIADAKKDTGKTFVSATEPSIVIPAEATAASVPATLPATEQKTVSQPVAVPVVATPAVAAVPTPKEVTASPVNPGTNTPFVRKSMGHGASKPKASQHPTTYTVSPATPE